MSILIRKNNKGFTLIELLVVMSIIAILGTVAVTSYVGVTLKAARSEAYTNLEALRLLEEQFYAENAAYAPLASLTGFQPGPSVNFTYAITNVTGVGLPAPVPTPYAGTTAALVPNTTRCFIATATGIAGTRVAGDVFAIDCNNNRNF